MSAVSFLRVIKFSFQDLYRNVWLSVATISVLILTLVSVNILLVINVLGKVALTAVQNKIDVSVHFKPEIEESRVQTVKISLLSLPEVKDVEYVSPSKSLEMFSDLYKTDETVIQSLGEIGANPFGSTLIIKARKIEDYPKILSALDEPLFASLIDGRDFDDRQAMISRVQAISDKIEWFGLGASLIFGLITLLIVFNTIRVSIYTHREEIGIMRLVGASNGFIRGPFYVSALIWSLLSLAVAAAVVIPAVAFAQPYVQKFFGMDTVDLIGYYRVNFLPIFGLQVLVVGLMSLMATKIATARYLRV